MMKQLPGTGISVKAQVTTEVLSAVSWGSHPVTLSEEKKGHSYCEVEVLCEVAEGAGGV